MNCCENSCLLPFVVHVRSPPLSTLPRMKFTVKRINNGIAGWSPWSSKKYFDGMVLFSDFRGCIISSYPQCKPVSFKCKSNIFFHWHQDTCKPFSSEKNYNLVIVFFVPKSTLTRAFKMRLSVNNAVIYRKKPHMVFGKWKRGVGCLFLLKKKWREVFSITYGARALLSHLFK